MKKVTYKHKVVTSKWQLLLTGFVVVSMTSAPALHAAPWEFGATAEVGVIYTDNVRLETENLEENETVYTIAPSFYLRTDGERTQADIRYSPEAYFYQDINDEDSVYHVFDGTLTTSLVRDRLFLALSGVNYQTSVTPAAALPSSNLPITGNRVDSRSFEARPYWQQRVGSANLLLEAGYRYLGYDDDDFQSSNERFAQFSLNNHAQQEGLAWGIGYNYRRMEYERSTPFEFQRAELNLGFWTSSALRLFAAGGAETSFDNIFESNLDEEFWEAGFQYVPNDRINLELATGERSYGSSFRADFSYTLRRGSLSLTWNESPTTRAETFFDRRPVAGADDLDNILDRPGNTDRFVRKRGVVALNIELNKSDLSLRAFTEFREDRSDVSGEPLPDEELYGIAARWEWRFGSRTSLDIAADLARRDDVVDDDDLKRYSLGLDYDATPRTTVRVEGRRSTQAGNTSGDSDYTENQARLLVSVKLR